MVLRLIKGGVLAGAFVFGLTSCSFFHSKGNEDDQQTGRAGSSGQSSESAGDPSGSRDPSVVRVKVVRAKEKGMERRTSRPASVHAFEYADMFAKISGYLEKQRVDIGSQVTKGEQLAQIFAPEVWADVDRTKASLKKSQADVRVKEAQEKAAAANLKEARIEVNQARADWEAAVATLEFRREEYTRYYKLVKARAIEAELVDEKREQRKSAEAKEFAARKKIDTMEARVLSFEADLVKAKADLQDAEANVELARATLQRAQVLADYTRITSPYTGVVTNRAFHDGDFIQDASQAGSNNKPLFRVARTDLMRVIMYVPDPDVPFVKQGQTADLFVDALQGHKFTGKVARMAYSEDYKTRTMRIEVDIHNPDNLLRDGMFGTMTIHLGRYKGVTVPSPCLTNSQTEGKRAVFVVRDNRAHRADVELLADDGTDATIRGDGLKPGDQIVAEHSPGLADGARVQPQESKGGEKKK